MIEICPVIHPKTIIHLLTMAEDKILVRKRTKVKTKYAISEMTRPHTEKKKKRKEKEDAEFY